MSTGVFAAPPDAGQLNELNREPISAPPMQAPQIDFPVLDSGTSADMAALPITRLRITGMTVFSEEELHKLVMPFEAKSLTLGKLQGYAKEITRYYRQHGYLLARAYVPEQELKDGEVQIAVLEGRVEKVEVDDQAGLAEGLRARLDSSLKTGAPLKQADLERVVLLNDTLPGIAAGARLRPGEQPGGTVVVLQTKQVEKFAAEASLDNHGNRYTGQEQLGVKLDWNNLHGRGDQVGLDLQTSGTGRVYGRAAWQFPLSGPWRLTVALAKTQYELGKEFANLDADGEATTASLDASYPLVLRGNKRLYAQVGVESAGLVDRIGLAGTSDKKDMNNLRTGLSLQSADMRGQSALTVQLTTGKLAIKDPAFQAVDATAAGTDGGFSKWNLSFERRRNLPDDFRLRISLAMQGALGNLTSAQKFSIGGPHAVRAYPAGEASGDDARLASVELQRDLTVLPVPWRPAAMVFADYGYARFNHDAWPGYAGANARELSAAGIGLDWEGPKGLHVSAGNAWRIGDERATAEPDSVDRFWFSLQMKL